MLKKQPINGSINIYKNYVQKYQGTKLKCFYSERKYIKLIKKFIAKEINGYPILVKKNNKDYLIIDGLHRVMAMKLLGIEKTGIEIKMVVRGAKIIEDTYMTDNPILIEEETGI